MFTQGEAISLKEARPRWILPSLFTLRLAASAPVQDQRRMVPLRHELKNGDMVGSSPTKQRPNKDWLKFVASGGRAKIRTIIRSDERERSRELGRDILERELNATTSPE